ncbi:MAG: isoaspartyl peptidase/L-asparaginase family protein [Bacteroidia bacterium]
MKKSRREFIKISALSAAALPFSNVSAHEINFRSSSVNKPIVLSTWNFGMVANAEAWKTLSANGRALDAVENGVKLVEGDPSQQSVGLGGRPDRDGRVTLDACIMDELGNIGSVACLEHIVHPVSIARAVMDKTPHVMLVGDGALQFALSLGYKKEKFMSEKTKTEWQEWLKKSNYKPQVNIENHDTIGMIAMDSNGNLSGACTTSGLAYKMHGRVGDSPIIGAGLFVDNEVGAATATGHGEEVIRIAGCHLVVELMRNGNSPEDACRKAAERVIRFQKQRNKNPKDIQVGFLALNKNGEYGGYAVQKGFNFAMHDPNSEKLIDAGSVLS